MNKAKVSANEAGQVITASKNNPEYGFIVVKQETSVFENGWMRRAVRSALISGNVADLKSAGFYAGQELDGKIIVKESLTPFNDVNPERDLKIAGDTGITCTFEGQPIYRVTEFTSNLDAKDVLIEHDNKEAIQAKYAEMKAQEAGKAEL